MTISRPIQLLIGAATCLPFIYMIYFFSTAFTPTGDPSRAREEFDFLFRLHLGTIFLIFALLIFYIVHLFKSERVPQDKKALWAVVLFLGNMIAMPVFWYLYIWEGKEKPDSAL